MLSFYFYVFKEIRFLTYVSLSALVRKITITYYIIHPQKEYSYSKGVQSKKNKQKLFKCGLHCISTLFNKKTCAITYVTV